MSDDKSSTSVPNAGAPFEVGVAKPRVTPFRLLSLGIPMLVAGLYLAVFSPGLWSLLIAMLGVGVLAYAARRLPVAYGALDVGAAEVRFGGERLATRGELSAAIAVPDGADSRVELRSVRRVLATLHVGTEAEARRLVAALGFAPGASVVTVDIPGLPWARALALAVALAAGTLGGVLLAADAHLPLAVLWAAACLFGAVLAQPLAKQRVQVGVDGLRIKRRGGERFLAFRDIQSVTASRGPIASVRLRLVSGASVRLELGARPGDNGGLAAGLADLVKQAKARGAAEPSRVNVRLGRNGREASTWLQDLRGLGAGADADHRRAPATTDGLWRALTSPESAGVERAAAAVALAGDPLQRGPLLRVADAVASPPVRIAIERAAEGAEDEALAEALLAIERDEARVRRR